MANNNTIYELKVHDKAGLITALFISRVDAERTFQTTYSKVPEADRPNHTVEARELWNDWTHL